MKLKVFMFGAEGVGKTELRKHLALSDYVNKPGMLYYRSIAPDFDTAKISNIPNLPDVGNVDIDIWDTSGNLHFKNISANMFYSRSHFGLFCIDLSKPLTPEIIRELEKDLDLFKEENPEALLFLVGTKSDAALLDALKNAQEQFTHIPFTASVSTSAREQNGSEELFELFALHAAPIVAKQIGEDLKRAEELLTAHKNKNSILKARDKCIIGSELFIALDKLNQEAQTLSQSQIKKLGKEANQLLNILANINIKDKIPAINAFVTHCTEEIQGKNHTAVSAVLSIAYAVVTAVIAAFIGFGIGCALGAWSGPGAFFSGLAAGVASAVTVVSTASVCGAAALGYSSYHFFKTTPVLSSIKDVAEKTVSTDLLELSF